MSARGVTVMVHRDGSLATRQFRLSALAARVILIAAITLIVTLVLVAALYGPIVVAAARTPILEHEVEQLRIENARVNELARRLDEVEARYAQMRSMLGGNIALPGTGAAHPAEEGLYVAPPILARAPQPGESAAPALDEPPGPSLPHRWPLSVPSYRTRGLAQDDPGIENHAGIDLAVRVGSDVRASGGGRVKETGADSSYGLYVLLDHPGGYQTMYGHLSRVIVEQGEIVRAGQVIAQTGNTGHSSAPHLHFEIRRGGRSIDPLSLVKEGN